MQTSYFKGFPKKSRSGGAGAGGSGNRIVAEKPGVDDSAAEFIVQELKKWRKRKAEDMNVPPYVIFGDKTMLDLAAKKPKSKSELLNVYGIGKAKAEEFGNSIIQITSASY